MGFELSSWWQGGAAAKMLLLYGSPDYGVRVVTRCLVDECVVEERRDGRGLEEVWIGRGEDWVRRMRCQEQKFRDQVGLFLSERHDGFD